MSPGKSRLLIKLGGSVLVDSECLARLVDDVKHLLSKGMEVVLVHGGGPAINKELILRGISWEFYQGQRITSLEMMEVIEMVLCGKVNKQIVRALNAEQVPAVGFSGVDMNLLTCRMSSEKLQFVGTIEKVNAQFLQPLIQQRICPIIAPVGVTQTGQALNINADWAASKIAQELEVDQLIYLTDQDGILDENGKVISRLDRQQLMDLVKNQTVKDGMLVKVNAIFDALKSGINKVCILNAKSNRPLVNRLLEGRDIGTLCLFKEKS